MHTMNTPLLLGIDIGTTGTKSILFTSDGQCLAHAYQAYKTSTPHLGWCEQNPDDWWNAVVKTVRHREYPLQAQPFQ